MINTLVMLGLVCLLATLMMMNFIVVIPKFGSRHFGAPDDIKDMMSRIPDRPVWINVLGVCIMTVGFVGVTAVLTWAAVDIVKANLSFAEAFIRFLIISKDISFLILYVLTTSCLPS